MFPILVDQDGIISHIRESVHEAPLNSPDNVALEDIRLFSPDDTVFIDAQTMMALQVFQDCKLDCRPIKFIVWDCVGDTVT